MPKMFELVTQTQYLSFDDAIKICQNTPAISQYAGIVHDSDIDNNGVLKPEHMHIMCKLKDSCTMEHIAKWFGLSPQFIEKIKAPRYEQGLAYLTHKNALEKHQYDDADVISNFDFVSIRDSIIPKKSTTISKMLIDDCISSIENGKLSIEDVKKEIGVAAYIRNIRHFENAHKEYLKNAPMPPMRQTIYIEAVGNDANIGKGSMGKTVATHALAKVLAQEFGADVNKDYNDLKDYIFDVGDPKVAVQNYRGQPILVLNEMTAYDLQKAFNGPRGVKELLETFPTKQDTNIKNSSTVIMARYIIINSIQPFEDFKNELAEDYVDPDGHRYRSEKDAREQYDRRFWVNIKIVNEEYMDFLFNKGLFNDTKEYLEYIKIKNIHVNWKKLIQNLTGPALAKIEKQVFEPIIKKLKAYDASRPTKICDEDDIPEDFLSYGSIVETTEDEFKWQTVACQQELPWDDI